MKLETYKYPHSSFLAMEKDMALIVDKILKNDVLKKLLFYTSRDCLKRGNLTEEQSISLFDNQIKTVPKFLIDPEVYNYIVIGFDNFITNPTNEEFRNNLITFDILCHYNQWQLDDFKLRPYRIAAEIDSMFNNQHLTGIGELKFFVASKINMNDEFVGICLQYKAIHGEEDKKFALNPVDDQLYIDNFNKIFNEDDE